MAALRSSPPARETSTSCGPAHPKGALRGRPGVNPLRLNFEFMIDEQTARNLKDFAQKLNIAKAPKHGREDPRYSNPRPSAMGRSRTPSSSAIAARSSPLPSEGSRSQFALHRRGAFDGGPRHRRTSLQRLGRSTRRHASEIRPAIRSCCHRRRCRYLCRARLASHARHRDLQGSQSSTASETSLRSLNSSSACPTTATTPGDMTWTACRCSRRLPIRSIRD